MPRRTVQTRTEGREGRRNRENQVGLLLVSLSINLNYDMYISRHVQCS